jgi:hypothetical protein
MQSWRLRRGTENLEIVRAWALQPKDEAFVVPRYLACSALEEARRNRIQWPTLLSLHNELTGSTPYLVNEAQMNAVAARLIQALERGTLVALRRPQHIPALGLSFSTAPGERTTQGPLNAPDQSRELELSPRQAELQQAVPPRASAATEQPRKGGANPAVLRAANRGSTLHSDKPGHLPDQLRARFPETEFEFTKPGRPGQDVYVKGGRHPSSYPEASWPHGVLHGDFKPDTPGGHKTFRDDQKNKWQQPTHMIPYDPKTGRLK